MILKYYPTGVLFQLLNQMVKLFFYREMRENQLDLTLVNQRDLLFI